eukprot:Rhum_TRINITY_DN13750_c0_g1::Rhum_TRINITY_DN13750_c0_g1_i1::g.63607::m.63607
MSASAGDALALARMQLEADEARVQARLATEVAAGAATVIQEHDAQSRLLMAALEETIADEAAVGAKQRRARQRAEEAAGAVEQLQRRAAERKEAAALALIELNAAQARRDDGERAALHIDRVVLERERELAALRVKQRAVHAQHAEDAVRHTRCHDAVEAAAVQLATAQEQLDGGRAAMDAGIREERDAARQHTVVLEEMGRAKRRLEECRRGGDDAAARERQLLQLAQEAEKVALHMAAAVDAVVASAVVPDTAAAAEADARRAAFAAVTAALSAASSLDGSGFPVLERSVAAAVEAAATADAVSEAGAAAAEEVRAEAATVTTPLRKPASAPVVVDSNACIASRQSSPLRQPASCITSPTRLGM